MAKMKAILVAVDGSGTSDRAVRHALDLIEAGLAAELHLLNVQPNLGGAISTFVSKEQIDTHHREEGQKGLATAIEHHQEGRRRGQGPYRRRPPGRGGERLRHEARRRPGRHRHARPYRPRRRAAGLGRPGRDRPRQGAGHAGEISLGCWLGPRRRKTAPHALRRSSGGAVVATRGAGAVRHPAVAEPRPPACRAARSPRRSPFQRDRDRIIHSTAFRRLKHKTQVFVYHEGDHYRTRLTHSLEVAQIARTICRTLRLDEDLGEAVALAHDLGHTPFGHAGEEALHAAMKPFGGFDHNAQTLRILTKLEERYAEFNGLNLTWETLEGAVKHNGPLLKDGRTLDGPAGRHRRILPGPRSRARRPCRAGGAGRGAERRHRLQQPRHRRRPARRPVRASPTSWTCRWSARCSRWCRQKYPGIGQSAPDPRGGAPRDQRHGRGRDGRDPPAAGRRGAQVGRRHPRARPAGGGLLRAHGRDRPHGEEVPLQAHVRALAAQPLALQGAPRRDGPVRPPVRRAQLPAAALARARRGRPNARPAPASSPTTSPA